MVYIVQSDRSGGCEILKLFENQDDAIYYASVLKYRDEHNTLIEEFEVEPSTGRWIDSEKLTNDGLLSLNNLDLDDIKNCKKAMLNSEDSRRNIAEFLKKKREDDEKKFGERVETLLVEYAKDEYELYKQCKSQDKILYDKMVMRECSLEDYKDNVNQMNLLKECMIGKVSCSGVSDLLFVTNYIHRM